MEDEIGYGKPPKEHQWKSGQSGNPAGRPDGAKGRATLFRKWLETPYTFADPTDTSGKRQVEGTIEDAMILGVIMKAAAGDASAAREVLDSVYGKMTDKLELDTKKKVTVRIGGRTTTAPPDGSPGD